MIIGDYMTLKDHLADKESSVLAERKATKEKIVEILEDKIQNIDANGDPSWIGWNRAIKLAILKIEEEVK